MKISEILVEAPNTKAIADLIKQNPDLTPAQIAALLKGGRQLAKPKIGIDAFGGKGADVSKAVANPTAVAKPNTPPPGTAVANPTAVAKPNTPPPGTAVAKPKKSAIVNPGAKAGQTPSAAGEFGSNKPRANIASTTNMSGAATNPQASAKFDQSKPTAVAKPAKKIGIQPGKTPSADTMDNRNK